MEVIRPQFFECLRSVQILTQLFSVERAALYKRGVKGRKANEKLVIRRQREQDGNRPTRSKHAANERTNYFYSYQSFRGFQGE